MTVQLILYCHVVNFPAIQSGCRLFITNTLWQNWFSIDARNDNKMFRLNSWAVIVGALLPSTFAFVTNLKLQKRKFYQCIYCVLIRQWFQLPFEFKAKTEKACYRFWWSQYLSFRWLTNKADAAESKLNILPGLLAWVELKNVQINYGGTTKVL